MKRRVADSFLLIVTGLLILSMMLSTVSLAAPAQVPENRPPTCHERGCNEQLSSGDWCAPGLVPYNGRCRNPACPQETDCQCPEPTPTPEPPPPAPEPPTPTPMPKPIPAATPVHYDTMKFYWHLPVGSRLHFEPTPIGASRDLVIDGASGELLDGPSTRILAGVPTTVTYAPRGSDIYYVIGVIEVYHKNAEVWPLWLHKDSDGLLKLCNAEKGVFPGFDVTNGADCE